MRWRYTLSCPPPAPYRDLTRMGWRWTQTIMFIGGHRQPCSLVDADSLFSTMVLFCPSLFRIHARCLWKHPLFLGCQTLGVIVPSWVGYGSRGRGDSSPRRSLSFRGSRAEDPGSWCAETLESEYSLEETNRRRRGSRLNHEVG